MLYFGKALMEHINFIMKIYGRARLNIFEIAFIEYISYILIVFVKASINRHNKVGIIVTDLFYVGMTYFNHFQYFQVYPILLLTVFCVFR